MTGNSGRPDNRLADIKIYRISTLLLLSLTVSNLFNSVFAQRLETRIVSAILTEFNHPNGPGGVFMVAQKVKVIYQKAFGKANLEPDKDMRTDDVFQFGLMTKQFTAVAVLILEE